MDIKNAVLILIVFNLVSLFPLLLLARLVSTQPRGMGLNQDPISLISQLAYLICAPQGIYCFY
jgi:hypothetical protein